MSDPFDQLLTRLTAAAARLAEARTQTRATPPAQRWRQSALLWPLFTKG